MVQEWLVAFLNWASTFLAHFVSDLMTLPSEPVPVTHGPRKSEKPVGVPASNPESVLVSWSAVATIPECCIHSDSIRSFASLRVRIFSVASNDSAMSPAFRKAARAWASFPSGGGQLGWITGAESIMGFGRVDFIMGPSRQVRPTVTGWMLT